MYEYYEKQWQEEMNIGVSCNQHPNYFGTCNLECPSCHEVGFYGPRQEPWPLPVDGKITRKYRACKWCGFWQETWGPVFDQRGGDSYKGTIVKHKKCGKESAWNTSDANKWCDDCGENMEDIGVHKDDPAYQQFKSQIDNIHKSINFPRISI